MTEERTRPAHGCAMAAILLYAALTLTCCGADVVGSAVTRICATETPLEVIDVYHLDEHGHYAVMHVLVSGDCVSVHGGGVVTQGWDSGNPLILVQLEDGRWGRLPWDSTPAELTYAPHLPFVRAPIQTTHYVLCLAFVLWALTRLVRAVARRPR